jgi:hypothetical protein
MSTKAEQIVENMLEDGTTWEWHMAEHLKSLRARFIAARMTGKNRTPKSPEELTQAEQAWQAVEPKYREFFLHDPEAEETRKWWAQLAANRAHYNEMGRWIKQAQLDAGEKPWDSYTQPQ